jgi:putative copper export protein
MNLKKSAIVLNGFIHDFAAGYWLAAICAIAVLHRSHLQNPAVTTIINTMERLFFWQSVAAMVLIIATGAGRTFTYVENWYGPDAEQNRRRMLIIKHVVLLVAFGLGYLFVWGKVFH